MNIHEAFAADNCLEIWYDYCIEYEDKKAIALEYMIKNYKNPVKWHGFYWVEEQWGKGYNPMVLLNANIFNHLTLSLTPMYNCYKSYNGLLEAVESLADALYIIRGK